MDANAERGIDDDPEHRQRLLDIERIFRRRSGLYYVSVLTENGPEDLRVDPNDSHLYGFDLPEEASAEEVWRTLVHPDDLAAYDGMYAALWRGLPQVIEYRLRRADGTYRWMREHVWPYPDPEDGRILLDGCIDEVEAEHLLRQERDEAAQQLNSVVETLDDYVFSFVVQGDSYALTFQGPGRDRLIGGEPPIGSDASNWWRSLVHAEDLPRYDDYLEAIKRGESSGCEYRLRGLDGVTRWLWERNRVRRRRSDGAIVIDGICTDVTDRVEASRELAAARDAAERRARIDELTGLANRRHFREVLTAAIEQAATAGPPGLVVVDIDRFKRINDLQGHAVGDVVITAVAGRIRDAVRDGDVVARWGGEEFVVLLRDVPDDQLLRRLAERIRGSVRLAPISAAGSRVVTSVSVGAARLEGDLDVQSLLAAADAALLVAKEAGRDCVRLAADVVGAPAPSGESDLLQTAETLALACEAHEPGAYDHAHRVSLLATAVVRRLGATPERALATRLAGLLHDVGKLSVSAEILGKAGALDADERERVEAHAAASARLVQSLAGLEHLAPIVRATHERVDGTGYPDGLDGGEIPVEAQAIAVADAYVTMLTRRTYAPQRLPADALAELQACAGTQFAPSLVQALAEALAQDQALSLPVRR